MMYMLMLMQQILRLLKEQKGVVAIEYGLLVALIALAFFLGAQAIGVNINNMFSAIADNIGNFTANISGGGGS